MSIKKKDIWSDILGWIFVGFIVVILLQNIGHTYRIIRFLANYEISTAEIDKSRCTKSFAEDRGGRYWIFDIYPKDFDYSFTKHSIAQMPKLSEMFKKTPPHFDWCAQDKPLTIYHFDKLKICRRDSYWIWCKTILIFVFV